MSFIDDPLYKNIMNGQKRAIVEFIDSNTEFAENTKIKCVAVIEPALNSYMLGAKGKIFETQGSEKLTGYMLSPAATYDLAILAPPDEGMGVPVSGVISIMAVGTMSTQTNPKKYTWTLAGIYNNDLLLDQSHSPIWFRSISADSVINIGCTGDTMFDVDKIVADNQNHWDFWRITNYNIRMKNKDGYPGSGEAEIFLYFKEG